MEGQTIEKLMNGTYSNELGMWGKIEVATIEFHIEIEIASWTNTFCVRFSFTRFLVAKVFTFACKSFQQIAKKQ